MAEDLKKLVEKGISRGYSLEKIQSDFANAGWGEAYLNNIPVYYNELKKKSPVGPKAAGVSPSALETGRPSSALAQTSADAVSRRKTLDSFITEASAFEQGIEKNFTKNGKRLPVSAEYIKSNIPKLSNAYKLYQDQNPNAPSFYDEEGKPSREAFDYIRRDYDAQVKADNQRKVEKLKKEANSPFATLVLDGAYMLAGATASFLDMFDKNLSDWWDWTKTGDVTAAVKPKKREPTVLSTFADEAFKNWEDKITGAKLNDGLTVEEIQDGVIGNAEKGNYRKAATVLGWNIAEAMPLLASMVLTKKPYTTAFTVGAGSAFQEVKDDDAFNDLEKFVYAMGVGAADMATEKLFPSDIIAGKNAGKQMWNFLTKSAGKESVEQMSKRELGDILFGKIPGLGKETIARAGVEEGFEEALAGGVQQALGNWLGDKPYNLRDIGEQAITGLGFGSSIKVATKGTSALLQAANVKDVISIKNRINQINTLLDDETISAEEKSLLSNQLNRFKTDLRKMQDSASEYYKGFSKEDVDQTIKLNQQIDNGLSTVKSLKTPEAKMALIQDIKSALEQKSQIEQKYDSTQKQQVPSPVVQGAQPGGVPIQGTSAEAPQAGGVLQVPSQQEEEVVKKTREVEASTPSVSAKPVSTTLNENNYQGIIGSVRQYVDNLSDNLFDTLGTSRQQVMNGVDSIANVLSSFAKSNRQIPITIYATEDAWKRGTGEQDVSRGIYVEGKVEGQPTKISIFLPALVGNTVYHEGLHDVVPKVFGVEGINEVSRTLSKAITQEPALASELAWFASEYDADENAEEFLVQLASLVSAGDIDIEVTKSLATRFMEAVAKVLGIAGIKMNPSSAQLSKALIEYAQRLGAGVALEEQQFDVKQKKEESPSFNKTFQGLVDRAGEIKTSAENIDEVEDMLEGNTEPGPVAPTQELKNPVKYEKIIKTRNSYKLSYVNPTNVVDIEKLIDEIVSEGKTVLFWAGDQLGVGQYKDPFTKKKYDLQGGPSYMLNPENVKRGAVWATGLSAKSLSERIKRDKIDYVFIISGGPLSMMFFNGLVLDMWVDRAQSAFENIDSFKESLGKAIVGKKSEALNDFNSWGELKEGLKNKKTLNKTRNVIKGLAETKTKRGLEFLNQYGLSFENFDGLRDGYFKDNNFDILDITTIYKPTVAIDGQSNHLTYPNVVMGELVGIPNRKVSSRDVMTEDFLSSVTKNGKERRGLPPSQIIKAIAGEVGMVQGVSRPRKAKKMKISGIPKFVETLDIRITPATTERVQIRVPDKNKNDIKKLSENYNKLLTDYSKSGDNSDLRRIDEVASQIMDGAKKRLKDNISRVRGAAIQFGDNYVGIWNEIFEPSLKLKLRITPESNEAAISRELALFAERYNQDGIIIETASEMEQQWINGEIDMPLAYDDKNGFTHFPQLLHNFDKELSDQQLADLSLKLKDEGVSFSMNKDELIVSIFPELEPNQENLSENEQYRAKESIFNDIFDKVTRSINDILRGNEEITPSVRIAKSIYIGGEETSRKWRSDKGGEPKGETYDTRTYDRSNFLKAFKEGLSNEEKLIPEFVALRNEEIQLSKQKKKLSPEKQARYDALRKIIQPLAESTFATNKNFYRATRLELNSIAEKYANEVDGAFASTFSIKRPARAAVKSLRWYGAATDELGDGARVNIIVRNENDADKLFEKLDNDFPAKGKEERRVRQETELGYPKRLLEVRNDLGFIGEIQVMTMNGYLAKDGVSYFNPERKDDARNALKKVQERIGWNIPDGLGHYFYEINRDENIDDSLRNQALFLSNGYYSAFNDPNFNLQEDYFLAEVSDFKKKVDNADKSSWDEGNKGESPMSLNRYLRSKGVKSPSKKTKKQIIGDSSKMSSWVRASKFKAVMMEEEGIDSEQIYFATGWERGTDKNWRYEAEPIKLTQKGIEDLIDKDDIVSLASLIEARPSDMPRSKDNETLLDFYPQLKDVDVLIAPYGSRTFYSYNEKVIQISKNVVDLGMDEFYLTIVHEVQHAVQHIEGFAVGAGLSSVESQLRSAITDAYDLRMTALAKSESIADDYQMVYEDFLADKENAEGEEIKDLPNSDSFIAYDKYKTYVEIVNSATFEYNFLEGLLKTRMQPNGKELITDFELYMAFAGEAEARNASRRAKMSKEERRSTPLSRSEDIVRDEQIVQYPGEVTSPKVKLQKISKAQGSQLDAQVYSYLLSISEKQPDNTYKLPFTLDDFLSYMVPTFSKQRATEIYENVSKGVTPEKVVKSVPNIDDAYEASRKLLDAEKNKKMFTWDAARKFFLDRQATLKAAILKAGMKNAYNLLVNRAGSGARANYFFSKQEKAIYDGLSSKDIEALDKIIMLRRIAEIDKNFDVRGEKRPIHPNKLNFESAQIGLAEKRKELGDAKFNELNDRANKYFDAFKSLLDSMYDEGLINEDLYNRLKNLDYQPRMFIEHVFDMDELSMRDINLSANQVKKIKDGSEDEIMFDSRFLLAVYSKSTFSRIARNKVNRAIAEATSVKGNEEWISKDPKKQFSEVTYFEDGVRKQFYIKSSLKGELDDVQRFGAIPPESQKYVGLLSGSYLLKLLATRANPLFVFRNIPRDYLHVLFFTNVYDNMNMPLAMYRLAGDAIKGVKGKIKDDQDYKDFIEYGGGMEYLSTEGKEGMMTNRSLLNRTIEKLGSAGELSEIAFRLGMYKRLVQESLKNFDGIPTEEQLAQIKVEAVTKSREMIDFAQGGVATKTLESAVPYINAAFQGFRVSSAYIKNSPKEFVIKLGQLAIGLAVIAMYNAVMGDDDMEDIPEDVKRKYFIIMTPFTEEKDGKTVKKYIKIAKTQQLIPFISSLDMSLEGNLIAPFMGREPRFNEDTIKQSWDAFLSYFPKDPSKPLDEALSSVPLFSALAAYKMNYDTYRKRIVSTDYQDKNVLPAYEDFSDKNVPYFYKAIGQAVDAGPKRLQVATEKFITTPYSSLITMGGYTLMDAIASNVYEVKGPGGYTPAEQEAISNKALKSAGINVEKIFVGTTDPDHKIYNKREQIERINLEASTERRGLKLQAKELGGKYFTAKEQGDSKGMNEALEAIRNARIEVRDKAVEDKNKQDYDYFNDALKTNMRFGPTFPQEYNDITFATDNEARAKIIAIRDMNMTQKELIDYLVDYKRKTGKSIDIRTIIREYDKFVTNEKK